MASVHKDGAHWRALWSVSLDGKRAQRSRTFATKREALNHARLMESTFELRGVSAPQDKTVQGLIEAFLAWSETRRRAATVHFYRHKLVYLDRVLGGIPLRRLTVDHLDAAYDRLLRSGGIGGKALHRRTVLHCHRAMHTALTYAVSRGWIAANPAALAQPPSVPHPRAKAPTIEEAGRLLAIATADPWAPLVTLALMSGLRRSELLGLRWADVDLDQGWLSVAQTCEQAGRMFRLIEAPKTKSSARTIALDDGTVAVMRAWRARLGALTLRLGIPWDASALVFPNLASGSTITPYQPDTATRMVRDLARKAGIPADVAPLHGLRHRHASSLMDLPLRLVADRMGHSTIKITGDYYQHGDDSAARRAANAAGAALGALIPLPGVSLDQSPVSGLSGRRTKRQIVPRPPGTKAH
jgi:integrase